MCKTDTAGRGAFDMPHEAGARTNYLYRIQVPRIAYLGRDGKKLVTDSLKQKNDFIYIVYCTIAENNGFHRISQDATIQYIRLFHRLKPTW